MLIVEHVVDSPTARLAHVILGEIPRDDLAGLRDRDGGGGEARGFGIRIASGLDVHASRSRSMQFGASGLCRLILSPEIQHSKFSLLPPTSVMVALPERNVIVNAPKLPA